METFLKDSFKLIVMKGKTKEEVIREMEIDDKEGIYSEEGREELLEDEDEISDLDEGFMKGYDEGEKIAECCTCGKVLKKDIVEGEFNDEIYRFCSNECASNYEDKINKR